MDQTQTKFKEMLKHFSDVKDNKFNEETIDRIINLSNDEELHKFMDFITKDINENGRFHIETEGIMIGLAEKYPNATAEELVRKYHRLWQ